MSKIFNKVKAIVAEKLSMDEELIFMDSNFKYDFGADSLDTVEILVEIEKLYDVNIPDDQLDKITTVAKVVKFIESALEKKERPLYEEGLNY